MVDDPLIVHMNEFADNVFFDFFDRAVDAGRLEFMFIQPQPFFAVLLNKNDLVLPCRQRISDDDRMSVAL